jgi:hypothetical protein
MDILTKTAKDAARLCKAIRAQYYIKLPTGEEFSGGLEGFEVVKKVDAVAVPVKAVKAAAKKAEPKRTRKLRRPFGAITNYFRPFLDGCANVGDVAVIPGGDFNLVELRSAIAAYCSTKWGNATHTSTMNREKNQIEVLRTAVKPAAAEKPASKVNGAEKPMRASKYRSVGHGLDSLKELHFNAYDDDQVHAGAKGSDKK